MCGLHRLAVSFRHRSFICSHALRREPSNYTFRSCALEVPPRDIRRLPRSRFSGERMSLVGRRATVDL